jgi:membrane-associated phospholipid phosphatase
MAAQSPDRSPDLTVRGVAALGVAAVRSSPGSFPGWSCDREGVPGFDRVAIVPERSAWQWASDLGLLAIVGGVTLDLTRRDDFDRVFVAAGSGVVTFGITELLKRVVGRPRPDRYLPGAGATQPCYGHSFPSGHTSVAFAFATSYWLAHRDLEGEPGWPGWLALAGATGVGLSRVAAGRHFPSDVVAGAILGAGNALAIYEIRF